MAEKSVGGYIRDISKEVRTEQDKAFRRWGDDFDKLNTPNDWHAFIGYYLGQATMDWAPDKDWTPAVFRENMKKVAALAQAAMLMVDLHGGCAPPHYEKCKRCGGTKQVSDIGGRAYTAHEPCPECNKEDLCDSCARSVQGCTISAGITASCIRYMRK